MVKFATVCLVFLYLPLLAACSEGVAAAQTVATPTPHPAIEATRQAAQAQLDAARADMAEADRRDAQAAPIAQLADPRRDKALTLLNATIDSDKYGPRSTKIMTQTDARAAGIIADDWSAAVAYLFLFGVATGNTGTIIKDSRNVSRLMADVARDRQDNEAGAVMGLPEVVK